MPEKMSYAGFEFDLNLPKQIVSERISTSLTDLGFEIVETDFERPWGGFVKISNKQVQKFIETFYEKDSLPPIPKDAQVDPKFLYVHQIVSEKDNRLVDARLSWQKHKRRGEFWKVIKGPVGVYLSETDVQPEQPAIFQTDQSVYIPVENGHRLASSGGGGLVAEIWINTDNNHPSDEDDIVRMADDFGRQSA